MTTCRDTNSLNTFDNCVKQGHQNNCSTPVVLNDCALTCATYDNFGTLCNNTFAYKGTMPVNTTLTDGMSVVPDSSLEWMMGFTSPLGNNSVDVVFVPEEPESITGLLRLITRGTQPNAPVGTVKGDVWYNVTNGVGTSSTPFPASVPAPIWGLDSFTLSGMQNTATVSYDQTSLSYTVTISISGTATAVGTLGGANASGTASGTATLTLDPRSNAPPQPQPMDQRYNPDCTPDNFVRKWQQGNCRRYQDRPNIGGLYCNQGDDPDRDGHTPNCYNDFYRWWVDDCGRGIRIDFGQGGIASDDDNDNPVRANEFMQNVYTQLGSTCDGSQPLCDDDVRFGTGECCNDPQVKNIWRITGHTFSNCI